MMIPEAMLCIDGVIRRADQNATYDVIGPWTGQPVGKAADASVADVDEAIAAARRAFDTTTWSRDHERRHTLLLKLHGLLRSNRQRLADVARHEVGSTLAGVSGPQVDGALNGMETLLRLFSALRWDEDRGLAQAYGGTTHRLVFHEAVGVVGAITAWNVPLYMNIAKVVSALLAGCTVILKPAPYTPSSAAIMGELAVEAGFPPGVINVLTGKDPALIGEALVTDPRVDLITFTGSTAVGKRIMEKGASTLKRIFLELGGKSATILLDDAPDFPAWVQRAATVVCYHAGQGCANPTRLLVPRSRYDETVQTLEAAFAEISAHWGSFDDPTHSMGPVISKRQLDRVMSYIELGRTEGARLLAGGRVRTDKGGGFFVEPTCFVDVKNTMRIAQEEIFGPVLAVIAYENEEDAIRIANESTYGLSGGVVSADKDRAIRIARRLRTGSVGINGGACIAPDLPFGGYKCSGIGREWGIEGIEEYRELKAVGIAV